MGSQGLGGRAGAVRSQARHRVRAPRAQQLQPADLCSSEAGLWSPPPQPPPPPPSPLLLQGSQGRWAQLKESLFPNTSLRAQPAESLSPSRWAPPSPMLPGESKQNVARLTYLEANFPGDPVFAWVQAEDKTRPSALLLGPLLWSQKMSLEPPSLHTPPPARVNSF